MLGTAVIGEVISEGWRMKVTVTNNQISERLNHGSVLGKP
jgi:hypothetical protein